MKLFYLLYLNQMLSIQACFEIPILQPLTGLSPEAVDEAFVDFKVSEEFKQGVIKNSEINPVRA